MRAIAHRQRLVLAAAAGAAVALLAACGPQNPAPNGSASGDSGTIGKAPGTATVATLPVNAALVSDGTNVVVVNGTKVTFPTKVSDAAFSHDGSRIAFVDGNGNIATARPDGTGLVVLTTKADAVMRSSPTWLGAQIVFTHRDAHGTAQLYMVNSDGSAWFNESGSVKEQPAWFADDPQTGVPQTGDTAPSASAVFGPGPEIAYQHTTSRAEVWIVDTNTRTPYARKLTDGAAAEVSPDGRQVAFVGAGNQVYVMSAVDSGAKAKQVTFGATTPSHLAWLPDGSRIAYQTRSDVESVSVAVKAGAKTNPVTKVSATTGVPTFLPPSRDKVVRVSESDPIANAVAASKSRWPASDVYSPGEGSNNAEAGYLTGSTAPISIVDGLVSAGSSLGPLLMTGPTGGLDPRAKAEFKRIFGRLDYGAPTVTILGGTGVVPAQAEHDLKALGYTVVRVTSFGATVVGNPSLVNNLEVADLSDSLSAARAVANSHSTLLFSNHGALSPSAQQWLNGLAGTQFHVTPLDGLAQQALNASWSAKPAGLPIAPVPASDADRSALLGYTASCLVVIPADADVATLLTAASLSANQFCFLIAPPPAGPADNAFVAGLSVGSAYMDEVYVVDPDNSVSAETVRSLAIQISGPLGYADAGVS